MKFNLNLKTTIICQAIEIKFKSNSNSYQTSIVYSMRLFKLSLYYVSTQQPEFIENLVPNFKELENFRTAKN